MKLSLVVPVYKVEQYLGKCVDSMLHQDLNEDEYEIILVDDGSPDGCGAICDSYASRYENIKVIHQLNGGLSVARNRGIEVAHGKYVQFVDSDDYLEPNVLKSLVDKMESDHLDILRFNYRNVNEQYELFEPTKVNKPFADFRDEACDGLSFLTNRLSFACYAWQFVIRRELLTGCVFREGIFFEDTEWTPRLMVKAARVSSLDLVVYNYLMRLGSITQSVDEKRKQKVLNDKLLLIDAMKEQMQNVRDKRWFEGMVSVTALSIIGYISDNYYGDRRRYILQLKQKQIFPLSTYHATDFAIKKIRIANISPSLLCFYIHRKSK